MTYEQAIAMIVRSLGGEEEAQLFGGYPEGHLAIAKGNDLLKNVTPKAGVVIPRANVAMIIFNCKKYI